MSMDDEFKGLRERAIADPASITRAEKNQIFGWPDPEEEHSLPIAKTGGNRAQFIAKAVAHPEQLTRYDTDVLIDHRGIILERDRPRGRPPLLEWDPLRNNAISMLRSSDNGEKEARKAAVHCMIALNKELADEAQLNGADTETLRKRFDEMKKTGASPAGIRTNCFLVASESAIKSDGIDTPYNRKSLLTIPELDRPTVYLQAVHPYYDASIASIVMQRNQQHTGQTQSIMDDPEMACFKGEVTVALPKVFDYLHCACFSEQGPTGWKDLRKRHGWTAIFNGTLDPAKWHLFDGSSGGISYEMYYIQLLIMLLSEETPSLRVSLVRSCCRI